jgi:flavodoxin
MKKACILLLALMVVAGLFTGYEASAEEETHSNILIAYFSRVGITDFEEGVDAVTSASLNIGEDGNLIGNCEIVAGMIHEATEGDRFQIITTAKYPSEYSDTTDQAAAEQDAAARPDLATHVENMDADDTIILVYPNWWGTLPMPLFTFLSEYDFTGKTIIPLCTHEGSRLGRSTDDIRVLCPNATLLDGLAIRGSGVNNAQEEVAEWIAKLGLDTVSE